MKEQNMKSPVKNPRPRYGWRVAADKRVPAAMTTRTFFTLIELLVVIAIIAILASMLLPALQKARDRARAIDCVNHMKGLGNATMMYGDNNHDFFMPHYGGAAKTVPLIPRLLIFGRYIESSFFLCPAFDGRSSYTTKRFKNGKSDDFSWHTGEASDNDRYADYGYNFTYLGMLEKPDQMMKRSRIRRASSVLVFADTASALDLNCGYSTLRYYFVGTKSGGLLAARHLGGGCTTGYADGRAVLNVTPTSTAPPHIASNTPYLFPPFSALATWDGRK